MKGFPNMHIPDSEKNEEYYQQCLSAIMFRHQNNALNGNVFNYAFNGSTNYTETQGGFYAYRNFYLQLYAFAMSKQSDTFPSFAMNNEVLPNTYYLAGAELKNLLDTLQGILVQKLRSKRWTANFISDDMSAQIVDLRTQFKSYLQYKNQIDQMFEGTGYNPAPFGLSNITDDESLETYINDLITSVAVNFENVANVIDSQNNLQLLARQWFFDGIVAGHFCGKIEVIHSQIHIKTVPFLYAVLDVNATNPIHIDDKFAGEYYYMTAEDVQYKYHLSDEEYNQLKVSMDTPNAYGNIPYLNGYNFLQPFIMNYNNVREVLVFEAQWKDCQTYNYIVSSNKQGDDYIEKEEYFNRLPKYKQDKRKNKYVRNNYLPTNRYAVMVGNMKIVDSGVCTNQVVYKKKFWDRPLDYIVGSFNTYMGVTTSYVEIAKRSQARIDQYNKKLVDAINRDIGKTLIMDSVNEDQILNLLISLQKYGVGSFNSAQSEDLNNQKLKIQEVLSVFDLGLDTPRIQGYISLIQYEVAKLRSDLHIPAVMDGNVTNVDNKSVLTNQQAMSELGLLPSFDTFNFFLNRLMSVACNKFKIVKTIEGDYEGSDLISNGTRVFYAITKNDAYEDLDVMLTQNDSFDNDQRTLFMQNVIQPLIQTGGINNVNDVVKIDRAKTYSQLTLETEKIQARNQKEKEQQMAMQQQQMQQSNQVAMKQNFNDNISKAHNIEVQEINKNKREELKAQTQLNTDAVNKQIADLNARNKELELMLENKKIEKKAI